MFPDISEFQGAVDWNALGNAYQVGQIEAVAMRASFGTVRADNQFSTNQRECRARGIPAIYYHFCYPEFNRPQAEAAFFDTTVGALQPNEAMVGDFEDDGSNLFPRGQAGVDWARAFLSALQAPKNATWWYTYPFLLSVIPFQQLYGVWPFWIADYSITPDSAFPQSIARQFTNCGATPGVAGCCDQSRVLQAPLKQWLTPNPKPPQLAALENAMIDSRTIPAGGHALWAGLFAGSILKAGVTFQRRCWVGAYADTADGNNTVGVDLFANGTAGPTGAAFWTQHIDCIPSQAVGSILIPAGDPGQYSGDFGLIAYNRGQQAVTVAVKLEDS
jgi:GH25 family lysozyme M1 (1,4-beta-N-acetylmuramidase)